MSALTLTLAAGLALGGAAAAQEAPGADPAQVSEVVVTGSRIASAGFTAPTPVTVVGKEEMNLQAPSNVGDILTKLPSFRATNTPSTAGVTSNGGGRYTVDLRGLGAARTLVLLDGHRFTGGTVDLNQIPTLLIDHADVVTGGASAAWGSDAVAGVVNLVLTRNLQGVIGTAQYGQSELGDNQEYRLSMAAGTGFAGGRGHVMIGGDYVRNDGIGDQYTRDWGRKEYGLITNSAYATNGLPNFIISPNVHNSTIYSGSIVTAGPLRGTAFAPDGTPFQYQFGQVFGNNMIGGSGAGEATPIGSNLGAPLRRFNVLARGEYEFSDALTMFTELSYAWSKVEGQSGQPRDQATLTIQRDNAYLPESVRQQMVALGLTTLTVGRQSLDFGFDQIENSTDSSRGLLGARGKIDFIPVGDNWRWDAYFQTDYTRYNSDLYPDRINANWTRSIDAVVAPAGIAGVTPGAIVCRSTLTAPTNGCIPTNIFGNGKAAPNAYTAGNEWYLTHTAQQVYAANIQGDLFSTWAGPVSIAAGYEFRRVTGNALSDPISQQAGPNGTVGGFNQGNLQPFSGKYTVGEYYAETVVPLLRDHPMAQSLDLNAAIRRTDYSTSGMVTTWKVGLSYTPVEDLRFRITRSRDIRAPGLTELYGPVQQGGITSIANRKGIAQQVLRYGGGNPDLQPEIAATWTAGVVYRPSWLPRLNVSLDYYNIQIDDVIASLGHAQIAQYCFSGQTSYCQYVNEDSAGNLVFIKALQLNLNSFKTAGFDLEVAYSLPLDSVVDGVPGALRGRFLGTYVDKLVTIDSTGSRDKVGQVSNNGDTNGVPHFSWNADIAYTLDRFSLNVQGRYVGKGVYNTQYREGAGAANTINDNSVGARFYTSLYAQYVLKEGQGGRGQVEMFGRVSNLFDVDPPFIPSGGLGGTNATSTNPIFYDAIGRSYTGGVRFRF